MIPLAEVLARWLDSDSVSENRAADEVRERATEVEALFAHALTETRRDERARIAQLLEGHSDLIGEFARDGTNAVRLVALMLALQTRPET